MHGYSRPVRCSLLAIPTVLNLFIFPPYIYVRVTFRLLLLYLSRMPIKLLKKKKKKNIGDNVFIVFITRKALKRECFSLYRVRISNNLTRMEQNLRQVNNKVNLFLLFNFARVDLTVAHFHDKRMQNSISNSKQDL